MEFIKNIGYFLAALLILSAALSGGLVIAVVLAAAGIIITFFGIVSFIAYAIKDYWKTRTGS
jgi:hypothetical protein